MRVVVLDTATKTGWAVLELGVVLPFGLLRLDTDLTKADRGDFQRQPKVLVSASIQFDALVAEWKSDFIVAESPHLRGASSFLTVAIYGIAEMTAANHGTGFYGVRTASWQSRIIPAPKGVAKAKGDTKLRSVQHVLDLGFDPETDDVADALCIAEYVCRELRLDGQAYEFLPTLSPRRRAA
ncbi:MAG TPA: hypothetical protein VIL88_02550 [Devosia sp.]|jgi:Holliday junction resolvasome RuvABC endonuclease subunit|uniref:hypothetical protein n=1 Tax=Devosia sp. TaxID=1871048 RepID=UPI002F958286